NCRDEFWHYSWGDSAWAVRVGESECPYGWAHPPVALESDFPEASAADLRIETSRDVHGRALSATGSCGLIQHTTSHENGALHWCVGLYWARDVPVTLRLQWRKGLSTPSLFIGVNKEERTPVTQICREEDSLLLCVTPNADRVILST